MSFYQVVAHKFDHAARATDFSSDEISYYSPAPHTSQRMEFHRFLMAFKSEDRVSKPLESTYEIKIKPVFCQFCGIVKQRW